MKSAVVFLVAILAAPAYGNETVDRSAPYQPIKGTYAIYSGSLGEQLAPTRKDRKLSFIITGQAAQDIFDSMYPDDKENCGGEGVRARTKGQIWCTYRPARGYKCYFGYDLRTGKGIGGGIC